ncbi:hypothetical protein EMA8858_01411 [Emticicia aquatica]|uniref:Uncharacterized protein n=1 Tax=Emticicia aquatica TaxID=1681835 RepID=A0ABM9ANT9_9BACT|nr:aminotransferase class IV [Emticicia aquatica]CAH0995290.1 hypothetical protein EMA8858_01411 [Emticicia aquatica]
MDNDFDFENTIQIPNWVGEGLYRCRISYAENIEQVAFFSYQFKHPKTLQIVENDNLKYDYKFEDRSSFQNILSENPDADDIIISQNGLLTDASYANLAFFDGIKWFTPSTYLLKGTKRDLLITNQQLFVDEIRKADLKKFKKIALINAMRDLDLNYDFEIINNKILIK